MTNSKPSNLDFGDPLDQPQRRAPATSNRQPAGEIIRIPTSPSEWTRKDKRVVSSAVGVGVFTGLIVWSVFAFLFMVVVGVLFQSGSSF